MSDTSDRAYLLFVWLSSCPNGGMNDLYGYYDSEELATADVEEAVVTVIANENAYMDEECVTEELESGVCYQIVDPEGNTVVDQMFDVTTASPNFFADLENNHGVVLGQPDAAEDEDDEVEIQAEGDDETLRDDDA